MFNKALVKTYKLKDIAEYTNGKGHEQFVVDKGEFVLINSRFISTEGETFRHVSKRNTVGMKEDIAMVLSDLPNGRALAKCFYIEENDLYAINQRICRLRVKDKNLVSPKYLYYALDRNKSLLKYDDKINQTNLSKDSVEDLRISIPDIEIQNEIVLILDKFKELEAELEAELEFREEQYNYYLENLIDDMEAEENYVLEELLDYIQPGKYQVKKADYDDSYTTPVLTAGKSFLLGYTHEDHGIYPASKENPVIIFDDFTTSFHWVDFPFKVKSSALKIIVPKNNDVNFRFIFYAMKQMNYQKDDNVHQRHWISIYSKLEIDVPSISEQKRIVNDLDSFSLLVTDLKDGLPAEIELRREQYEYYRNKLLTFESEV